MATVIVTRAGKGAALTYQELDDNFTNLQTAIDNFQGGGLADVVSDTTPQLGGDLDVNGFKIVSANGGNIEIDPDGGGDLILRGNPIKIDAPIGILGTTNNNIAFYTDDGVNPWKSSLLLGPGGTITIESRNTAETFSITSGANLNLTATTVNVIAPLNVSSGKFVITNRDVTSDGTITLSPGVNTGNTVLVNKMTYNELVRDEGVVIGTYAPNAALGAIVYVELGSNITINGFTSPQAGQSVTLIIDNAGSYTLTSTMLFAGGVKTLTPGGVDIMSIFTPDGVTYFASLAQNFS